MMKLALIVLTIALTAISVLGQSSQTPPTVRIVTEDPNLPSDLYYGNTKVKPVRIRPGTNRRITIDDNDFFIHQHFVDFLSRLPDTSTYNQKLTALNNCAAGNTSCDRIAASYSFFNSVDFIGRGSFVYKMYITSFARKPKYTEFIPSVRQISPYQTAQQLEASKAAFADAWVIKPAFKAKYPASMTAAAYVDALAATAHVTLANRNTLVSDLQAGRKTRAQVLRAVAESTEVNNKYYYQAFVHIGYFGYYRRDPDTKAAQMINQLTSTRDYRATINIFISSPLYRGRF
jgi:hypothetical protein